MNKNPSDVYSESIEEDFETPLRDAEYYKELSIEIDADTYSQRKTITPEKVENEIAPQSSGLVFSGDGYFENELMFLTNSGVKDIEIPEIIERINGAELLKITGNLSDGLAVSIRINASTPIEDVADVLLKDSRVVEVERNSFFFLDETDSNDGHSQSRQNAVVNEFDSLNEDVFVDAPSAEVANAESRLTAAAISPYAHWVSRISLPSAWDLMRDPASSNIRIAVIDTGINTNHPALKGKVDTANSYNAVTGEKNQCPDNNGHGTAVASVISSAFTAENERVIGASNGVKLLGVSAASKDEAGKTVFSLIDLFSAYDYIASKIQSGLKIKVVNMSYGSFSGSSYHEKKLDNLFLRGATLVASAGNESVNTKYYPSGYENVLSVSSVNSSDARSYFSNYGPDLDLCAPGENILTASLQGYSRKQGTSFSSPIVAGVAGLICAQNPNIAPGKVKNLMTSTATDLGVKGKDQEYGYGRVNAFAALRIISADRVGGATRYSTAQLVTQYGFSSASTAIVVSGEDANFPDALSASGLAGLHNAPIISTTPSTLSTTARNSISKLGIKSVIIVGGTAAVSTKVATAIKGIAGVTSVVRVAGDNRYLTADAVYSYAIKKGKSWVNPAGYKRPQYPASHKWKNSGGKKMAILATGVNFPDALAASSLSAYGHYPIFLTDGTTLSSSTSTLLKNGKFDELLVVGGSAAIKDSVVIAAQNAVNPKPLSGSTKKWAWGCKGSTRYDTAYRIASHALLEGLPKDKVILASGETCADATVSSSLKKPILLVHPTDSSSAYYAGSFLYYKAQGINRVVAVGGTSAISDKVLNYCLRNLWSGQKASGYQPFGSESAMGQMGALSTR